MAAVKVSRAIEELLDKLGLSSVSLLAGLSASWASVAGPLVARKSRPSRLKGGVLTLRVPTHAWAQELSMASPILLDRIGARIGPGKVTEIRFQVGSMPDAESGAEPASAASGEEGAKAPDVPGLPLPEGLDRLRDPEIREILASLSRKAGSRRR